MRVCVDEVSVVSFSAIEVVALCIGSSCMLQYIAVGPPIQTAHTRTRLLSSTKEAVLVCPLMYATVAWVRGWCAPRDAAGHGLGELVGAEGHTDSSCALFVAMRGGSMYFRAWKGGGLTL